jgi:hypothetical protein
MSLCGAPLLRAISTTRLCSDTSPAASPEQGRISMWVKIVSQWVIYAVFIWILIAPVVCSGRDFS